MKSAKAKEIHPRDQKAFGSFLSEDEELVLATGFGKYYMRNKFALYFIWPGILAMALGAGLAYLFQFNIGIGLLGGTILAGIWAGVLATWHYHANRYILTTRRIIIKKGLISVKLISALYDKITHIEVSQGILDRFIMKHGDILINTAGGNKDQIKVLRIDNPIEFKNLLERLINREREKYGGSSGPVVAVEGEIIEEDRS